jgi:DNA-binding beta-propeller fold protein YncE
VLFQERTFIPVPPGARPGFDHADVYALAPGESRLYAAHTGADRVDVFDCAREAYLRPLLGHPGVAGVLIDSERDLLLTSDRGCGRLSVYRCSDESLVRYIEVGVRPNGIAYDPARRNAFAFNLGEPIGENCTVSVASLDKMEVIATIPLPGRPRWAIYEPARDRVFANIREPSEIVVIDAQALKAIGAFDIPAIGPHGLALAAGQLICAADEGKVVALDPDGGQVLGTADLPGEPDVVMYDAGADQLFVAVGDPGIVLVLDRATLRLRSTLETEGGTHTIAWDPATRALFAFLPTRCGALAFAEVER